MAYAATVQNKTSDNFIRANVDRILVPLMARPFT